MLYGNELTKRLGGVSCLVVAALCCEARADVYEDPTPGPGTLHTFYAPVIWPTNEPYGLQIADVSGYNASNPTVPLPPDGRPDVVVINRENDSVSVFRNTGVWQAPPNTSGLAPPIVFSFGTLFPDHDPYGLTLGDIDGDGDLDAMISMQINVYPTEEDRSCVAIFHNDGAGQFSTPVTGPDRLMVFAGDENEAMTWDILGITSGDWDGNSRLDICVAGFYFEPCGDYPSVELARVEFHWQETNGDFELRRVHPTLTCGRFATDVVVSALNSPAANDIAVSMMPGAIAPGAAVDEDLVSAFINLGNRLWDIKTEDGTGSWGVTAARYRPSTVPWDVATGDWIENRGRTYFNNGAGVLAVQSGISLGGVPQWGLSSGTVDCNFAPDIAIACSDGGPWNFGCVSIMFNNGLGTGWTLRRFNVHLGGDARPKFCKLFDLNGDGRNDLITSCTGSDRLSVLIKRPCTLGPGDDSGRNYSEEWEWAEAESDQQFAEDYYIDEKCLTDPPADDCYCNDTIGWWGGEE